MLSNPKVQAGLIALAAVALCAFVQRNFVAIPVIGDYLPK